MKYFQDTGYRSDTEAFALRCVEDAVSQAECEFDLAEDELWDSTYPVDDSEQAAA